MDTGHDHRPNFRSALRILHAYNQQRSIQGGEEQAVLESIASLLEYGCVTDYHHESSRNTAWTRVRRISGLFSSIYNPFSAKRFHQICQSFNPDIVHAHNLYPNLSPSILITAKKRRIPVIMTIHSQILTCPTWYHLYHGKICELCVGGKEYWCVIRNCRENIAESTAYATRNAVVRVLKLIHDNVSLFVVASDFMRSQLRKAGIPTERIRKVPNAVAIKDVEQSGPKGTYVAYAGRFSEEKGIRVLLKAAALTPSLDFRLAGDGPLFDEIYALAPPNVRLLGMLSPDEMTEFYSGAKCFVIPSVAYETFSLVAAEAMSHGIPVIASDIGALPETIGLGSAGVLVAPGEPEALATAIMALWDDDGRRAALQRAGCERVRKLYSPHEHARLLVAVYEEALSFNPEVDLEPKQP